MAKALRGLALILVVAQVFSSEISRSQPIEGGNSVAAPEVDSADRTAGLFGKKVELIITKEVLKNPLPVAPVLPPAPAASTAAPALATAVPPAVTPAPLLPPLLLPLLPLLRPVATTTAAPAPAHHHHHHHTTAAPPLPPVLNLNNNPIVIDNATVTTLLQQLLAGNIKNVQAHGRPLVVPPGGKPVAVVFSAALHVVDIGNLLPAVKPPAHPAHHHAHAHPAHAPTTHAPILETLLQSLHLLSNAKDHAVAAAAIPATSSSQPVIVMVPLPAAGPGAALPADPIAQLETVIIGLKKAKKQILLAKLHAAQHVTPAPAVVTPALPPAPLLPAAATTAAPVPVALPVIKKVKKVELSITKHVG